MKSFISVILLLITSSIVQAAGYSNWAKPTEIEYVNDGLLVVGSFGNPNGCEHGDRIFISRRNIGNDAAFQSMLSIILAAHAAQKELRFYSAYCFDVTFHGLGVSESRTAIFSR